MKDKKVYIIILIATIISITSSYVLAATLVNSKDVYYEDNSGLAVNNVQAAIDGTCTKFSDQLTTLKQEILNEVYPVGSIYISTTLKTTTEVQNKFGGTWASYGVGKTLLSSTTSEQTGGSNTVTLSTNNLPAHTHDISHTHTTKESSITNVSVSTTNNLTGSITFHGNNTATSVGLTEGIVTGAQQLSTYLELQSFKNVLAKSFGQVFINANHTHTVTGTVPSLSTNSISTAKSGSTGGGTSFSVQNEYITVYMYKRTK